MYEPSATPFGAGGRAGTLDGMRIHFCDLDGSYAKPSQRRGLQKAIGLQVQGHGAVLASFTASIDACVDRALTGDTTGTEIFEWNGTDEDLIVYDAEKTGTISPTFVADQIKMLDHLPLNQDEKADLVIQITTGATIMAQVQLHDTDSEDGDVVALVSGSVRIQVPLRKAPRWIAVPIHKGNLIVEGVYDGGGGITVGVRTQADDKLRSPVMRVGEQIKIPFVTS